VKDICTLNTFYLLLMWIVDDVTNDIRPHCFLAPSYSWPLWCWKYL